MKLKIFYQLKTRSPFLLIESKSAKKYSARRWFADMTNLWHNVFRKLFTTYEKKYEDYLSPVQLAISIIIYMRIILGQDLYIIHLSSDD